MSTFLICLWAAAILARFACAIAIVSRGLARSYPFLLMASSTGAAVQAYGFGVWAVKGYAAYRALWFAVEPYAILWDALLLVSVVRTGARNFRHGANLAFWLSAILLILAGAITLLVSRVRGLFPEDIVAVALFAQRNHTFFCVVFTFLAVFAFTRLSHGKLLRRNSLLILWVLMLYFTLSFAGNAIGAAAVQDYTSATIMQMLLMGGPLFCFGILALKLSKAGEQHTDAPPPQAGDVQASEEGLRKAKDELREMGRRGR